MFLRLTSGCLLVLFSRYLGVWHRYRTHLTQLAQTSYCQGHKCDRSIRPQIIAKKPSSEVCGRQTLLTLSARRKKIIKIMKAIKEMDDKRWII